VFPLKNFQKEALPHLQRVNGRGCTGMNGDVKCGHRLANPGAQVGPPRGARGKAARVPAGAEPLRALAGFSALPRQEPDLGAGIGMT